MIVHASRTLNARSRGPIKPARLRGSLQLPGNHCLGCRTAAVLQAFHSMATKTSARRAYFPRSSAVVALALAATGPMMMCRAHTQVSGYTSQVTGGVNLAVFEDLMPLTKSCRRLNRVCVQCKSTCARILWLSQKGLLNVLTCTGYQIKVFRAWYRCSLRVSPALQPGVMLLLNTVV